MPHIRSVHARDLDPSRELLAAALVSNRHPDDGCEHPTEDLAVGKGADGKYVFTRKDGSPA